MLKLTAASVRPNSLHGETCATGTYLNGTTRVRTISTPKETSELRLHRLGTRASLTARLY